MSDYINLDDAIPDADHYSFTNKYTKTNFGKI